MPYHTTPYLTGTVLHSDLDDGKFRFWLREADDMLEASARGYSHLVQSSLAGLTRGAWTQLECKSR